MIKVWNKAIVPLVLALVFVSSLLAQPTQAASACKNITLTAHRGSVDKRHTENTFRAFTSAINKGTDAIEFDIRVTNDHQWMVMHDNTVNRTTNGSGKLAVMTADTVRSFHVDDSAVTGKIHRVPFLTTIVNIVNTYPDLKFQIEFKAQYISDSELSDAMAIITNAIPSNQVMITSVDIDILNRIRALNADAVLGYIEQTGVSPNLSEINKSGVNFVNAHIRDVNKDKIAKAHSMGMFVSLRGANKAADWQTVINKGADNLVTDNVAGYNKWCQ